MTTEDVADAFVPAGYDTLVAHLEILLSSYPPSFIFIHDPEIPRITCSVVHNLLSNLLQPSQSSARGSYAFVDAVTTFTPRLFYDTVLNALTGWDPKWEDGCENWLGTDGQRWNENLDAFLHGLKAVSMQKPVKGSDPSGKGKARATVAEDEPHRMILVVERAERLKETLPDLLVPLTRLAELAQVDITTVFISDVRWEGFRPSLGASPEPYYVDVSILSKQATIDILESSFPADTASSSSLTDPDTYHSALRPLYGHFISTLYSICSPFTRDPHELMYIAAARWPGFVQPVLDAHRRQIEEWKRCSHATNGHPSDMPPSDVSEDEAAPGTEQEAQEPLLVPPTEDVRIRLTRLFTPSLTAALDALYPRLTNAEDWARMHKSPPNLLAVPPAQVPSAFQAAADSSGPAEGGIDALPRLAKFVLVAAFLASTNPPKSDMRMFGRGPDERAKRRRRRVSSPRKPKPGTTGGAVKIPQRLLGPTSFPLDRLIAILGVLLEENDVETRPVAPQYTLPGEYTDMEISRVAVYAEIMELASIRLLLRTSSADKLDNTPTFKCGISYDVALRLARDVGVMLNDLMWEPA